MSDKGIRMSDKGSATLEMALVAPLLLLLWFGMTYIPLQLVKVEIQSCKVYLAEYTVHSLEGIY